MIKLSSEKGFLGYEKKEDIISYEQAKAVIIPFGLELSTSYGKGTRNAPKAILRASQFVELFDEELYNEPFHNIGIVCLKEPKIKKTLPKALSQIEDLVTKVINDKKFPLILGGEHSIIAGAIRPFLKLFKEIIILHFDAHTDLRDSYLGQKYSHATGIRRCLDFENIKLLSCGIRSTSKSEMDYYEENKDRITIFWAKDKKEWNLKEIISNSKNKYIYISFDVDVFDSSLMPATGTPEPGGLFWDEVINIIREVSKVSNIIGCDINELSPIKSFHSCDFLVAKLAYKILSFSFKN